MTNFKDALHVSQGDGRYFCIWSDADPLDSGYYAALANWYVNGGNGLVVRWLLNRDVSGFDPKKPAPHTSFKDEIQATSKSALRHKMEDMIDALDKPFHRDVVRTKDVERELRDHHYSARAIASALVEMGCPVQECRRGNGDRAKFWLYAVRDFDSWQSQPPRKWLDEYEID